MLFSFIKIHFLLRMPSADSGTAFSETANNERILFTSESVGEGHPGMMNCRNSDQRIQRASKKEFPGQLNGVLGYSMSLLHEFHERS